MKIYMNLKGKYFSTAKIFLYWVVRWNFSTLNKNCSDNQRFSIRNRKQEKQEIT